MSQEELSQDPQVEEKIQDNKVEEAQDQKDSAQEQLIPEEKAEEEVQDQQDSAKEENVPEEKAEEEAQDQKDSAQEHKSKEDQKSQAQDEVSEKKPVENEPLRNWSRKERFQGVIETFLKEMPSAETELDYRNPYELLVAVVLSAQCTDKRINMVTPPLFEKYPNATALAKASFDDIHEFIKSVTFPNNKTKALMGLAKVLVEKYGGEVPEDIDSLLTLPGVGRKTANVILNVIYGKAVMPVDTHVFRVSERLGFTTKSPNPGATEKVLMKNIPEEHVQQAHHWLILHGRYVCKARKPECEECYLKKYCRMFKQQGKNRTAQTLKKDAKKGGKKEVGKEANPEGVKGAKNQPNKEAPKKESKPKAKSDSKKPESKEAKPKKTASNSDTKADKA